MPKEDISRGSATTGTAVSIPPPPQGGVDEAQRVSEAVHGRASTATRRSFQQAAAARRAAMDRREALRRLFEPKDAKAFDQLSQWRPIRPVAEELQPNASSADWLEHAREAAIRQSRALLERANVEPQAMARLNADYHDKLARITSPSVDPGAAMARIGRTDPLDGAQRTPFVRRPPYDGAYAYNFVYVDGGSVTQLEDNSRVDSGQFGHVSRYENYSAGGYDGLFPRGGDGDIAFLRAVSEIGFWYRPEVPGTKSVSAKIRCKRARADMWLDDEFGWSSSSSYFWSKLHVNIHQVHGLEYQTGWWEIAKGGNPEDAWYHYDWLHPETTFWLSFSADFPPDSVYVAVGCEDQRSIFMNDVSTDQTMDSRYLVEEVHIAD